MSPAALPFEKALRLQQQVAEYVRQLDTSEHSVHFSERDVIRTALILANEATVAEKLEVMAFLAVGGPLTIRTSHPGFVELVQGATERSLKPEYAAWLQRDWDSLRAEREWMRSSVELVMSNPAAARIKLRKRIEEATREILVSSPLKWDGTSLVVQPSYLALTVPALTGYAMGLLLDDKRGLGSRLLRCALEGCGSIFLSVSSGKGGRPPLYCTAAHQALAVKLSGPARTEKWRKSKAKKRGK